MVVFFISRQTAKLLSNSIMQLFFTLFFHVLYTCLLKFFKDVKYDAKSFNFNHITIINNSNKQRVEKLRQNF